MITEREKDMVHTIVKRWHGENRKSLSVEQAAYDIGILCGIIIRIEEPRPDATLQTLRKD